MPETDDTRNIDPGKKRAANLLDIRRIIGAVLLLYGVVLTIAGIVASEAEKTKAAGENVNLWTGIALIVVGVLMIVWGMTRPLVDPEEPPEG